MRAVRLTAPNQMALGEVAMPEPGPGEVLVRVEACGLCGSDRHMLRGEFPTALPVTLGHEFAGHRRGGWRGRVAAGHRRCGSPAIRTSLADTARSACADGQTSATALPPSGCSATAALPNTW